MGCPPDCERREKVVAPNLRRVSVSRPAVSFGTKGLAIGMQGYERSTESGSVRSPNQRHTRFTPPSILRPHQQRVIA